MKEDFKIIEEYYNKSGTLNDNYNNFLRKFHQEVKGKSKKKKLIKLKKNQTIILKNIRMLKMLIKNILSMYMHRVNIKVNS